MPLWYKQYVSFFVFIISNGTNKANNMQHLALSSFVNKCFCFFLIVRNNFSQFLKNEIASRISYKSKFSVTAIINKLLSLDFRNECMSLHKSSEYVHVILRHAEKYVRLTVEPGIDVVSGQQTVDSDLVDDVEQKEGRTGETQRLQQAPRVACKRTKPYQHERFIKINPNYTPKKALGS